MLQTARITGPLPLLDVVSCALLPEDLESIPYSSRLLLPASLPDVIVNDVEYVRGCEAGFGLYFDYPEACVSLSALKEYIMQELFPGPLDTASLAQRVAFQHGFLSALALTDRALALKGLSILARLTDHLVFLSSGVCS